MEGLRLHIRLILLCLLVLALTVTMGGRLMNMQLVHGVEWSEKSGLTSSRSVAQEASRGGILDRFGRPLVQNSMSYAITIDHDLLMSAPDSAGDMLALVRAAMDTDTAYTDELPISLPPFAYAKMTAEQEKRLRNYIVKNQWKTQEEADKADDFTSLIPAEKLMSLIREKFHMGDAYSDYEARLAIGVLYEADMRAMASAYPAPYLFVPSYVFTANADITLRSRIAEEGLAGVRVYTANERIYATDAAAHILGRTGRIFAENYEDYKALGYSGDETVGVDGAEKAFESYLRGISGNVTQALNEQGRLVSQEESSPPIPGGNVYLTIDIVFQAEAERLLAEGISELWNSGDPLKGMEAEAGSVVVLDVNSGEVLAMANYPTYDLSRFNEDYAKLSEDPLKPFLNRAISGTYAPGSTFKMVTAAAGMASGFITTSSQIRDLGRYTFYSDYQPRCHVYPGNHGLVNVMSALKVSCNYFFYDVGRNVGINTLYDWAHLFGLGVLTGIELDGEQAGYAAGPETSAAFGVRWEQGNTLSAAIGQQNNMFTPLQLANYTAAIANGGTLYRPHILKEVRQYDYSRGVYVQPAEVIRQMGLTSEQMRALQTGMEMVTTQGGSGYSAMRGLNVSVAAKTGSVQIGEQPNNGVFVAYAPADNPQIALALVVEKGGAGSRVAPIARNIIDAYFRLQGERGIMPGENAPS